ncbi:hypothetical protein WLQ65_11455 [Pseudoalteromonas piscicida]|uniref:hypothetical protein n=1 Tax=Pseudoalteromonas piscicida TaxID=43662 RepID=UPI0030C9057C
MHKTKFFALIFTIFISVATNAASLLKLDKKMIDTINDHISDASSQCDFEESTKYYFGKTRFFDHSIVDGKEVVQEQTYSEAMSVFKDAMDACYVSLAKEKTISESIEISKTGQEAIFKSEAFHYLKSNDGRLFESHNKGKVIFGVVDGEVRIMESHYFGLVFQEIEKLP